MKITKRSKDKKIRFEEVAGGTVFEVAETHGIFIKVSDLQGSNKAVHLLSGAVSRIPGSLRVVPLEAELVVRECE